MESALRDGIAFPVGDVADVAAPGTQHDGCAIRFVGGREEGVVGNALNALLSAASMNFGKLLAAVVGFWFRFLAVLKLATA